MVALLQAIECFGRILLPEVGRSNLFITVDYKRWCKAVQDGLGLPGAFEFRLPAKAHICEMHFAEGKRYTRGLMQDPSVFRKLAPHGVSPILSRLGPLRTTSCAVARCSNAKTETLCISFPKPDDSLHTRWIESLQRYGESFAYHGCENVCLKHFSLTEESGVVPVLYLDGDSESESAGSRASLKRKNDSDGLENSEEPAKRSKIDSHEGTDRSHSKDAGETAAEKSCCEEIFRISETVEQIERTTHVVESVIEQLQITCKNYYKEKGELNQHLKFQLFDILSELKSQKGIVHSLMTCFVTVGTTRFDELVNEVLKDACISALRSAGVNKIKIQMGAGEWDADVRERVFKNVIMDDGVIEYGGIPIEYYRFKPDIQKDMENSMTSCSFARRILSEQSQILKLLGKDYKFEIAIGLNGRIWIKSALHKDVVTIYNVIKWSEYVLECDIPKYVENEIRKSKGFPLSENSVKDEAMETIT